MVNDLHKPLTEGQGSYGYTLQGSYASLQGTANDDLLWLLLERLMDFSMQCRQSANAFARSQSGHTSPLLQELLTLLRMPQGGGYGTSYNGGFQNPLLMDKISYLISKLEQYDNSYQMGPNQSQLPSAGPVLEILFQMLRNQNQQPAKEKQEQEYPEHIKKHLKELGDRMLKIKNVPSEGQTLDLLLTLLSKELEADPQVNRMLITNKNKYVPFQNGSFNIYAEYNPAGSNGFSFPLTNGSALPALNVTGEEKEKSEIQKLKDEHKDAIKTESLKHFKRGYLALDKKDYRLALEHFKLSKLSISSFGFDEEEGTSEITKELDKVISRCEKILSDKVNNSYWSSLWPGKRRL